jgi:Ribosomal L32p protein family
MTWAIVIWSITFLWLTISQLGENSSKGCKGNQTCVGLNQLDKGFGVAAAIFIGFVGFVALLFTWFMTRPPRRVCPSCGETVRPRTTCKKCGYDFKTGTPALL